MTDKETVSARVPPDTLERFETYRNERNLSKSDAGRRLIERGLPEEEQAQSSFELWVEASRLIYSWALSFVLAGVLLGGLGSVSGVQLLLDIADVSFAAAALAIIALAGTLGQQSRIRKTDEGIGYRRQVSQVLEGSVWHLKTVLGIDGRAD